MDDPLDKFKLPPELYKYLSKQGRQQVVDKIFDIDKRFLEREPKLEAGYQYGHHLWELFDEAAYRPNSGLSGRTDVSVSPGQVDRVDSRTASSSVSPSVPWNTPDRSWMHWMRRKRRGW